MVWLNAALDILGFVFLYVSCKAFEDLFSCLTQDFYATKLILADEHVLDQACGLVSVFSVEMLITPPFLGLWLAEIIEITCLNNSRTVGGLICMLCLMSAHFGPGDRREGLLLAL